MTAVEHGAPRVGVVLDCKAGRRKTTVVVIRTKNEVAVCMGKSRGQEGLGGLSQTSFRNRCGLVEDEGSRGLSPPQPDPQTSTRRKTDGCVVQQHRKTDKVGERAMDISHKRCQSIMQMIIVRHTTSMDRHGLRWCRRWSTTLGFVGRRFRMERSKRADDRKGIHVVRVEHGVARKDEPAGDFARVRVRVIPRSYIFARISRHRFGGDLRTALILTVDDRHPPLQRRRRGLASTRGRGRERGRELAQLGVQDELRGATLSRHTRSARHREHLLGVLSSAISLVITGLDDIADVELIAASA
jgi:hypothetical protein